MQFTDEQLEFCTKVRGSPRDVVLRDLVDLLVPPADLSILQRLGQLQKVLDLLNLQTSPNVGSGSLDSSILVSSKFGDSSAANVVAMIAQGEGQQIEFKSTFSCCLKTLHSKPDLQPKYYAKPEIEDACLSAIAGFINTGGGVVLIGVGDMGEILGLEDDFYALGVASIDRWELYVRRRIETKFVDGRSILPLVSFSFVEIEGIHIARAAVQPRAKLAFLHDFEKPTCPPKVLRRMGNQTLTLQSADLEEFFEQRSRARNIRLRGVGEQIA